MNTNADDGVRRPSLQEPGDSAAPREPASGVRNTISGGIFHGTVIQADRVTVNTPDRTVDRPACGLPAPSSFYVGHEVQLASLLAALERTGEPTGSPVHLVTGPGGVGKSELLLQAAHTALRKRLFPGGVLFVDLQGHTAHVPPLSPGEALGHLLHQLGLPAEAMPAHLEDRAAAYRQRLTEQPLLVVLDNAHDSEQVRPMLPPRSRSMALVSSRRLLPRLDDVRRTALGELPHEAAVRLLLGVSGRAEALGTPDASATDELGQHVSRIAERCGGMPLALRIAAARLLGKRTAAFADFAEWLADEQTGLHELDDGERRMTSVFSVSYRDLEAEQRDVFARCGLHPTPRLGLHAAAALTGLPLPRLRRLLEGLCGAHLLQEEGRGRYRMHGLLHDYARERAGADLPAPEREAAVSRLIDHYLATADRADRLVSPHRHRLLDELASPQGVAPDFSTPAAAQSWLAVEVDNVTAVCRAAAVSDEPARSWLLADVLRGYFFLAKAWTPWESTHRSALDAAEAAGAHREQGILHNSLGLALLEQRDLAAASGHYSAAAHHFEIAGDTHGIANATENHAWVLHYTEDYSGALADHQRALRLYEQLGAERNRAITLRGMALAETELDRFIEAVDHLREASAVFSRLGLHLDSAMTLNGLGEAFAKAGDFATARLHLLRALRASRSCGSKYEEARARRGLGSVTRSRAPHLALHHWKSALRHYTDLGSPEAAEIRALIATVVPEV
ncbi:tetratricopeptide repeat protein [Streptomyces sp. NPDC059788]|uniref:tetratricopeptide repeat protein n=1 Tax=Streptomyces sp. NPDC059788 TaxID=3346948 RepID=UPI003653A8A8